MDAVGLSFFVGTAIFFTLIGILYARKRKLSVESYVTSRNTLGFFTGAATIFATGMGAWILFSPAESAVAAGIYALVLYALASSMSLWIFMWLGIHLRKIMPHGHTLTEFVLHRYGKLMYYFIVIITITYMAIALAAELTGISLAAKMVFGIPAVLSASVVAFGTVAYTALGGFRTSVFTDKVQANFILPLLALVFIGSLFFIGTGIFEKANAISPESFRFTKNGVEYGITLIIAIIGAELFNQSWWQRVYSAKNEKTMKKSFLAAGLLVFPVVLIAGIFGFFAVASNLADNPSVAMFTFLLSVPKWILISAMVLAVALIMSTVDTLLNGIVSIFTVDIARIKPSIDRKLLLRTAQILTLLLSAIAVYAATKGYSVLYLFLVADLVCVASAVPVFYGIFASRYSGKAAFFSALLGLIAGAVIFPNPSFTRGSLLWSFAAAFFVPLLIAPFASGGRKFDFDILKRKVKEFD